MHGDSKGGIAETEVDCGASRAGLSSLDGSEAFGRCPQCGVPGGLKCRP